MRDVVGVEASHNKGESRQQPLHDRQRVGLANALHAPRELVLGDLFDAVDVKDPHLVVEVTEVHRVQPTPARAALRARLAAYTGRRSRGAHGGASTEHPRVDLGAAQGVQMTVQDPVWCSLRASSKTGKGCSSSVIVADSDNASYDGTVSAS